MAVFRCKMCGGTIESLPGATVGVCDSCGTRQTLPSDRDEAVAGLHNRANTLRLKCEFDKAEELYNKILSINHDDAEAHWGIILCKYGIEYVEDPKTFRRVPTCHRTSFDAIEADPDYSEALAHGDYGQREIYRAEAVEIDRIQKSILDIVRKEKPFDVFICYKETDEDGRRTADSEIAEDIYEELTEAGYKVFYSAVTLDDKLGEEYEPYIFAALTSAKVMLAVATKPEYYSAVWVKNEWSRFLRLIKTDSDRLLIPCYRDMDAYDLPEDFAHLQAQNMDEIGFIKDITRAIARVVRKDEPGEAAAVSGSSVTPDHAISQLMKRARIMLESGKWAEADKYCERALDLDVGYAGAYLVKLLAQLNMRENGELAKSPELFDGSDNYKKIMRFGDEKIKAEVNGYLAVVAEKKETERRGQVYDKAMLMTSNATEKSYSEAAALFASISGYMDADSQAKRFEKKAYECRCKAVYEKALQLERYALRQASSRESVTDGSLSDGVIYLRENNAASTQYIIQDFKEAMNLYLSIRGWSDAGKRADNCRKVIAELEKKAAEYRRELERRSEARKRFKEAFKIAVITGTPVIILIILLIIALSGK